VSEQELPSFQERLKAFVVTELAGLLKAVAAEKQEVEDAVKTFQEIEARSNYGKWA